MVYGMVWRARNGVWPSGHRMVYGMAWRGISWYVERHSITCFKALPWAIVLLEVLFTDPGPVSK